MDNTRLGTLARRGASPARRQAPPATLARPTRRRRPAGVRVGSPPPPSRTKWTRLVHPFVLIGHVSSLGQVKAALLSLDGLLDYNLDDKLERAFELSLFAELYHEMLQAPPALSLQPRCCLVAASLLPRCCLFAVSARMAEDSGG